MQKITPFLWFDNNAEEAAKFYVSVFKKSKIIYSGKDSTSFELDGETFIALNGDPHFKFNEAISFVINCKDQEEVDYYWERLSADPKAEQCGWIKDKYGVSWQVVPTILGELLAKGDSKKTERMMKALMKMKKLIVKDLEDAYEGE